MYQDSLLIVCEGNILQLLDYMSVSGLIHLQATSHPGKYSGDQ